MLQSQYNASQRLVIVAAALNQQIDDFERNERINRRIKSDLAIFAAGATAGVAVLVPLGALTVAFPEVMVPLGLVVLAKGGYDEVERRESEGQHNAE